LVVVVAYKKEKICQNDHDTRSKKIVPSQPRQEGQTGRDEFCAQFLPVVIKMADALDDEFEMNGG